MKTILSIIIFLLISSTFVSAQYQNKELIFNILENFEIIDKHHLAIDFCIKNAKEASLNRLDSAFYSALEDDLRRYTEDSLFGKLNVAINHHFSTQELEQLSKELDANQNTKLVDNFIRLMEKETASISKSWIAGLTKLSSDKVDKENNTIHYKGLEKCKQFHEGTFKYTLPDEQEAFIIRHAKEQIEIIGQDTIITSVEWLNDCEYKLRIVYSNNQEVFENHNNIVTFCKIYAIIDKTAIINLSDADQSFSLNTKLTKID
jgi:hypothetical protein